MDTRIVVKTCHGLLKVHQYLKAGGSIPNESGNGDLFMRSINLDSTIPGLILAIRVDACKKSDALKVAKLYFGSSEHNSSHASYSSFLITLTSFNAISGNKNRIINTCRNLVTNTSNIILKNEASNQACCQDSPLSRPLAAQK